MLSFIPLCKLEAEHWQSVDCLITRTKEQEQCDLLQRRIHDEQTEIDVCAGSP